MEYGPKQPGCLRVLCLGDVVGKAGRHVLARELGPLRSSLDLDLVIVNGENAAGGIGLTPATLSELLAAGADIVTSGNHIWRHKEIYAHLEKNPRLLRPANYPVGAPGRGHVAHILASGHRVLVLNLQGRVYMETVDCPFTVADALLSGLDADAPVIRIVDFHAEATSEKRAMAHYLDGRVSAVLGTHTHVQTADAVVSSSGTASLTDLGMCGVEEESVIGFAKGPILERFITARPHAFKSATGQASLNGALLEIEKSTGKALSIALLRRSSPK